MDELKNKIEALLFSSGRFMALEEIKRLCRVKDDEQLRKAMQDLKIDYDNRDSSLILIHDEDMWKITTKESFLNIIRKIITETELPKSLMETLAVIAWKYPIKQSDLIEIRTNKAYDHIKELEEKGYITRQKFGRSRLIKLTEKFFSYFDLPADKIKQRFSDFDKMAHTIKGKEEEIKNMNKEQKILAESVVKEKQEHEKSQNDELKQVEREIDLIDENENKVKLDTFEIEEKTEIIDSDKQNLEVYDTDKESKKENESVDTENKSAEEKDDEETEEKPNVEIYDVDNKDNEKESEESDSKIDEEAEGKTKQSDEKETQDENTNPDERIKEQESEERDDIRQENSDEIKEDHDKDDKDSKQVDNDKDEEFHDYVQDILEDTKETTEEKKSKRKKELEDRTDEIVGNMIDPKEEDE